jgi:hypothetical protein
MSGYQPLPPEWNDALHNMLGELAAIQAKLMACEEIITRTQLKIMELEGEGRIGHYIVRQLLDTLGPLGLSVEPWKVVGAEFCLLGPLPVVGDGVYIQCDLDGNRLGVAKWLSDAVRLWREHQEEELSGG